MTSSTIPTCAEHGVPLIARFNIWGKHWWSCPACGERKEWIMPDCPWCGEPLRAADNCDGRCVNGHEWWDEGES